MSNLVLAVGGPSPFLDFDDIGLVLLCEKLTALFFGINIHNKETDDIGERGLGCRGRRSVLTVGWAVGARGGLFSILTGTAGGLARLGSG